VCIECLNESDVGENILKIEKDINISYIHWVNMSRKIRLKVAKKLNNVDFVCTYVLYSNPILQNIALENVLIQLLKPKDGIPKIVIDGESSKKYENNLKSVLKNRGIKVYSIKFTNDKKYSILRLADFMAGLIRSYFDDKGKDNDYMFKLLKDKINS
jgi:hypothetical protein